MVGGAGRRNDGEREGHLDRRGETRRRQPVGGQPGVHPRRLGLQGDDREGAPRGGRTRLPPERAGPVADHRQAAGSSASWSPISRTTSTPRWSSGCRSRCRRRATTSSSSWPRRRSATSSGCCRRSSTTRSTASCWPRSRCPRSLAGQCQAFGIPVVLFNRDQDDPRLSSSPPTTAPAAARSPTTRRLGQRRIAYIAGFEGASTQRDREAGFREGLAAHGRELYARGVGNFEHPQAREAARRMFDRARPARRGLRLQRPHGVCGDGRAALRARPAHPRGRRGRRLRRRAARGVARLRPHHLPPAHEPHGRRDRDHADGADRGRRAAEPRRITHRRQR